MREMGEEEVRRLEPVLQQQEQGLSLLLLPKDPRDERNIYLEVRAGTGGDEAAIFAGDLLRMYTRYAESRGWQVEILSESLGEHGGYKEVISRVVGRGAFSVFKFESGAHRVQRVPATEAQGRIHTSACTVAVLPEQDEIDSIDINPGGPARGYLPRFRSRRPACQQDRLGHPHHAHSHRRGGGVPGRTLPAQEPLARDVAAEGAIAGRGAGKTGLRTGAVTQAAGGAVATAPNASAPTTFRRVASPTTASTSRCTSWPMS